MHSGVKTWDNIALNVTYHCDYFGFGFTTLNQKVPHDDELLLQDNKGGGGLFNSAVYLQYWLVHQHDNPD